MLILFYTVLFIIKFPVNLPLPLTVLAYSHDKLFPFVHYNLELAIHFWWSFTYGHHCCLT